MSSDDKYIIRPGGNSGDEEKMPENPFGSGPSLEEYVFANSVVQSALIQLMVDKGLITLEDLNSQVEKIRKEMGQQ